MLVMILISSANWLGLIAAENRGSVSVTGNPVIVFCRHAASLLHQAHDKLRLGIAYDTFYLC